MLLVKTNIIKNINTCTIIALITALAVVNQAVSLKTFDLGVLYYGILIFTLLTTFFQSTIKRISMTMTILYIACILSILLNDINAVYRPWERFILFVIVTFIASPFIQSDFYDKFRVILYKYIHILLTIVIIISIPYIITGEKGLAGFGGFTNHSMLLAPISAVTLVTLLYQLYLGKYNKIIVISLIVITFIALLLAASRVSLAGAIVAIIYFFYRLYSNNKRKFGIIAITIIALMTVTYPLWGGYMEGIEKKNEAQLTETGEINYTGSRDMLWSQRIREFKSSPLVGVGFGYAKYVTNVNERTGRITFQKTETGTVEPGSSWLGALSMTGLLGFTALLVLWFKSLKNSWKVEKRDKLFGVYIGSTLIFWAVHMIAEGQIFAAGSFLFFMVWITFGAAYSAYNIVYKR
ncbi:MAG: O-antigen ligase family protein [Bacteroidales bacterium]|nr:O-antigen ligase family protein [Bacteroidales bacterium]